MMKRLISFLCLLCVAQMAWAQTWTEGARTVSYPGGGSGSYTGVIGDGSTTQGGDPPAVASEPASIGASGYTASQWITATSIQRQTGQGEDKARFVCNSSHVAQEDPIVFHGMVMSGHWHEFVGNTLAGKDSDYSTLRSTGKSTCPGGPINRTAYWHPLMFKLLSNGAAVGIRSYQEVFYYVHNSTESAKKYRLLNGYAFIGGVNPADPTNTTYKSEIPAGFTVSGNAGPNGNGFLGWGCYTNSGSTNVAPDAGGTYSAGLQTVGGTDPWGGRCTAGMELIAVVVAPYCWDGHNLTSPNGRGHVRYAIKHTNSGADVCPDGWWQVPAFEAKTVYIVGTGGWADYSTWYLSSDRFGFSPANYLLPGSSFHFDWMNGWQRDIMDTWLVNCNGVKEGATAGNGAACDYSTISATQRLLSDSSSPDTTYSNSPIVNLSPDQRGKNRYYPGTTSNPIPGTIHNNTSGMNDNMPMPANDTQLAGAAPISFSLRNAGR